MTTPSRSSSAGRNLVGWVAGYACSQLADHVVALAIAWAAIQRGSPATVGGVIAAGSIPRIIILLFGGALADRIDARIMIAIADGIRAVTLALSAGMLLSGSPSIGFLITVSVLIGIADGLFQPAAGALSTRIVPGDQLGRVAAVRTTVSRLCLLAGGPISGVVIARSGTAAAFAVAAALFVGSVAALFWITMQPAAHAASSSSTSLLRDVWNGLGAVRAHPSLPWLLIIIGGVNLGFSGPVTAGIPILAHQLRWGPATAGAIYGAFGLGAGVAGFGLVFVRRIRGAGRVTLISGTAMTAALAAFSIAGAPVTGMAAGAVLGVGSGVFGTTANGLMMAAARRTDIGRVMSLNALVLESVVPISLSLSGLLAAATVPSATFAAGALVMALVVGGSATRRSLRDAGL